MPLESWVIQGSILGPSLFTQILDSLLGKLPGLSYAFADNLQIFFEVKQKNSDVNQSAVLNTEQ